MAELEADILERVNQGGVSKADVDLLENVAGQIGGKCLCLVLRVEPVTTGQCTGYDGNFFRQIGEAIAQKLGEGQMPQGIALAFQGAGVQHLGGADGLATEGEGQGRDASAGRW